MQKWAILPERKLPPQKAGCAENSLVEPPVQAQPQLCPLEDLARVSATDTQKYLQAQLQIGLCARVHSSSAIPN
jgi:hypothetical protein